MKRLQAEQDAAAGRAPAWRGPRHHDLLLIQHHERHSDLRLHTYRPRALGDEAWFLPLASRVASLEQASLGGLERRPARLAGGSSEAGAAEDSGSLVRMNPLAVLQAEDLAQVRAAACLLSWLRVQAEATGAGHAVPQHRAPPPSCRPPGASHLTATASTGLLPAGDGAGAF